MKGDRAPRAIRCCHGCFIGVNPAFGGKVRTKVRRHMKRQLHKYLRRHENLDIE